MILRADHVAGAVMVVAGAAVLALSGDLPFGSLSFPGAGFMPKVIATLIVGMGVLLVLGAGQSEPFSALGWDDLRHAAPVLAIAAVATFFYTRLGFAITLAIMMFALLVLIERKRPVPALLYSLAVVALAYVLFTELRAPIPDGPLGF